MESTETGASLWHWVGAASAATAKSFRFSQLSVPRQALIRLCQSMNYGSIHDLCVKDTEPVFSPPPPVLIDVRLDADQVPRPEVDLPDFELCSEVRRLIGHLEELKTGTIERIEVRAGIPRRIVFSGSLAKPRSPLPQTRTPDQPSGRRGSISNK